MRIELDIPEWAIGRHIYIMAGAELLAHKPVEIVFENGKHVSRYLPLTVKTDGGRCSGCAECCAQETGSGIRAEMKAEILERLTNPSPEGGCELLAHDGCVLKGWIPFGCLKSICTEYKGCTEIMEEVSE